MLVSVILPTKDRPQPLARALASLSTQILPRSVSLEIVVVDNSAGGEAAAALAGVIAVHEPRPGVARARNAGVARARGQWIAFLDDDEEAAPDWIAALVDTVGATGADAVFGPVEARAEGGGDIGAFAPYFARALTVSNGADLSGLTAYLGTNNSMFRASCLSGATTFDTALDECGGEDSLLIEKLRRSGARFAYAAKACVIEWAPARRLDWAYVVRRKFLSGQIRVFVQAMVSPYRLDRIALWMAVGAAQFLVFGAAALALSLSPLSRERAQARRAAAYGGLGKIFWQKSLRPTLYGAGHVS